MDSRVRIITKTIRKMDSKLFAQRDGGKINIYRESTRWESFSIGDDTYLSSRINPEYIMSLTDNWSMRGKPVEWGLEPICRRLREIDGWNRLDLGDLHIKQHEKAQESRDRDRRNKTEAFMYDFRSSFHKATSEINTALIK